MPSAHARRGRSLAGLDWFHMNGKDAHNEIYQKFKRVQHRFFAGMVRTPFPLPRPLSFALLPPACLPLAPSAPLYYTLSVLRSA